MIFFESSQQDFAIHRGKIHGKLRQLLDDVSDDSLDSPRLDWNHVLSSKYVSQKVQRYPHNHVRHVPNTPQVQPPAPGHVPTKSHRSLPPVRILSTPPTLRHTRRSQTHAVAFEMQVREVYARREPWFAPCVGYEFGNYATLEHSLEGEVERLFRHVFWVEAKPGAERGQGYAGHGAIVSRSSCASISPTKRVVRTQFHCMRMYRNRATLLVVFTVRMIT